MKTTDPGFGASSIERAYDFHTKASRRRPLAEPPPPPSPPPSSENRLETKARGCRGETKARRGFRGGVPKLVGQSSLHCESRLSLESSLVGLYTLAKKAARGNTTELAGRTFSLAYLWMLLSTRENVGDLGAKVALRESPIHGLGVFAKKRLGKGNIVTFYPGDAVVVHDRRRELPSTDARGTRKLNKRQDETQEEEGDAFAFTPSNALLSYFDNDMAACTASVKKASTGFMLDVPGRNCCLLGHPSLVDSPQCLGHMLNDGLKFDYAQGFDEKTYTDHARETCNCEIAIVAGDLRAVIFATKDIEADEECLVPYGVKYWMNKRIIDRLLEQEAQSTEAANDGKKSQSCMLCRKPHAHLRCSKCKRVYYCNHGCQRLDWRWHRIACCTRLARHLSEKKTTPRRDWIHGLQGSFLLPSKQKTNQKNRAKKIPIHTLQYVCGKVATDSVQINCKGFLFEFMTAEIEIRSNE